MTKFVSNLFNDCEQVPHFKKIVMLQISQESGASDAVPMNHPITFIASFKGIGNSKPAAFFQNISFLVVDLGMLSHHQEA